MALCAHHHSCRATNNLSPRRRKSRLCSATPARAVGLWKFLNNNNVALRKPNPLIGDSHLSVRSTTSPFLVSSDGVSESSPGNFADHQQQRIVGPILSCSGGGIYFFWQLGVMKYVLERFDVTQVTLIGASAGGLIAALASCEVDLDFAVERAYQLSEENRIWERPLGLVGIWGSLVRQWLDDILPENADVLCQNKLKLIVTEFPSLQQVYVDNFESRSDLLDACMASAHVPIFLDWRPLTELRGKLVLDGSLQDFIKWDNSPLLKCDGRAFVLDYTMDTELQFQRGDFLKLRLYDEVLLLIRSGYDYAKRLDANNGFDAYLGTVRFSQKTSI